MTIDAVWVLGVLAGAGAVIAVLFKLLITSKDRENTLVKEELNRRLAEIESVKKSYQEIAAEALKSAIDTANYYRQRDGKPPIIPAAPVVSESHSPSTEKQREAALVQTMRAKMAMVKLATGQEARPEPERADESRPVPTVAEEIRADTLKVLKQDIAMVPERTAEKVVEKLQDESGGK